MKTELLKKMYEEQEELSELTTPIQMQEEIAKTLIFIKYLLLDLKE